MRRPLVIGNWKLNGSREMANTLVYALTDQVDGEGSEVAIAPPFPYLDTAGDRLAGSPIRLAAQDVSAWSAGPYTGEVSAEMLKDVGVSYVIVGHSERRTLLEETDDLIAAKFRAAKVSGLVPVLCIGETEEENAAGKTEAVCARQLDAILNLESGAFRNAVVAYEPVWAIGTGKSATPQQAQAVHSFIRAHIAKHDRTAAENVSVLYGGSVNPQNAAQLLTQPDIDGALVGGASLKADEFALIVKEASAAGKR